MVVVYGEVIKLCSVVVSIESPFVAEITCWHYITRHKDIDLSSVSLNNLSVLNSCGLFNAVVEEFNYAAALTFLTVVAENLKLQNRPEKPLYVLVCVCLCLLESVTPCRLLCDKIYNILLETFGLNIKLLNDGERDRVGLLRKQQQPEEYMQFGPVYLTD